MKTHTRYILLACSALFALSVATATWADDVSKLVESCTGCHGEGGASTGDIPNIGGYSAAYLSGSLKRFKNKERPCVMMCEVVKDSSDADIMQIAEYFAGQKFVRASQKFDPELAKKGKEIHERSCEMCHAEGGSLAGNDAGMLAGQKMAYLEEQLKFIGEGHRHVPQMMMSRVRKLDKTGIEALANYYGSFKSPSALESHEFQTDVGESAQEKTAHPKTVEPH